MILNSFFGYFIGTRFHYNKVNPKVKEEFPVQTKKYSAKWMALTALLMAMNILLSMEILSVPVPGGHLYFNDTVICLASLLLDPVGAFAVGGLGAFLGDMLFYPEPMFVSLVTHGLQAVVISLLVHKVFRDKNILGAIVAVLVGAVIMVAGYTVGRTFFYGAKSWSVAMVKLPFEILQAALGVVFAPLLAYPLGLKKQFDKLMKA